MDKGLLELKLQTYKYNRAMLERLELDLKQNESQPFVYDSLVSDLEYKLCEVDIFLDLLIPEERFVVEEVYFEQRYMSQVSRKWVELGNEYHGVSYWKNKKRKALEKILTLTSTGKAPK